MRLFAFLVVFTLFAAPVSAAQDQITLQVNLDTPGSNNYLLAGQSAFIQSRQNDGTSGGQLDGQTSPGGTIQFTELFPPAGLSEYQTFSYFGIVETRDSDQNVLDTSLVVGFRPGNAVGHTIDEFFPHTEAELVNAMTTQEDSPEFLDMLDRVGSEPLTRGNTTIPQLGVPGDSLDLIAFIGGANGDLGVDIGDLSMSVERVPEPASLGAIALAGIALRRRAR